MGRGILAFIFVMFSLVFISGVYAMTSNECFGLASQVGVTPHYGVLSEEGQNVSLGKPYGFEGLYTLKVISLKEGFVSVGIGNESARLAVGESAIISGINFTFAKMEVHSVPPSEKEGMEKGITDITLFYCAFETKEARLKLTCQGCVKDNACLPFGTRTDSAGIPVYCDLVSHQLLPQKAKEAAACEQNYECLTNTCINSICIDLTAQCAGCKKGDACLPVGTRTESEGIPVYCGDTHNLLPQKAKEAAPCTQHYECLTNLCIDSSCVEQSLLQKIISWFRSIFG